MIFYETSGIEYIQGGDRCFDDPDDTAEADGGARAMLQAECTDKERNNTFDNEADNSTFVLNAESDVDAGGDGTGTDDAKNLALVETGRFTGVFQGYVRLTDADGPGTASNPSWGLPKTSAVYDEEHDDGDVNVNVNEDRANPSIAVIGVNNGPITITYKDSNGNNQEFVIEIDFEPPTISVDSPDHKSRSDDEKPSFIGSFNDNDAGLAADSFQLDVDNRDDEGDDLLIMKVVSGVWGTFVDEGNDNGQVRRRLDYRVEDDATDVQYGVVGVDIYRPIDATKMVNGEEVDKTVAEMDWHSVQADDFDDGAPDGEFNDEVEIDFDEVDNVVDFEFNHEIDFQALVRDLAGNVGFSDSDIVNPRFIDDLGADEKDDRDKGPDIHNVLGVFSRHIVYIDDKDPVIVMDQSVTGFYGLDDDDDLVRDRSAVMVVFDNTVNGELIDTGTFELHHDEESAIAIEDVLVDGKLVFLKLGEELASDATPTLSMSEGREVEDLAGNILNWQEQAAEAFEVNDGILPVFTLTLSGGSGTGVRSEGPSMLTNGAMDIAIESDEDINGTPNVAVVCSNIGWTDDPDDRDLNDYLANRNGVDETTGSLYGETGLLCGSDETGPSEFREAASLSRPGNNWAYAWRNASAPTSETQRSTRHLNDGNLVVVVWGRDRSSYDGHNNTVCDGDACEKWGIETSTFVLDDTFNSPLKADGSGGSVQPEGSEVKEPRPFIYLDFAGEGTSVDVTEFIVDGEDVRADVSEVGDNRFLYWPEALEFGTHKVEFDARDAADNEPDGPTSFEFDVTARDPFVINLTAGWNAISVPANPVDTALDAVFTEEAVDRVVGWNPLSATGPWSIATRIDGVWTTSANFAPLTDIVVRYGYWVHSMAFTEQSVDLKGQLDRESGDNPDPVGIITVPGWNFVGVVDQDGDQTEGHFGKDLEDSEDAVVTADHYMPGFRQAYTWDAIANGYRVLDGEAAMEIGQGIWVFFPDDTTIAP